MAAILYDHTARNQNVRANILVPKRKFLRAPGRIVHVECPFRRVDTGFWGVPSAMGWKQSMPVGRDQLKTTNLFIHSPCSTNA